MNIAIYARQSIEKKDSLSIQAQINDCKNYINAKYQGANISIYKDAGYSGKNTARPDLQKLLEQIEQDKIEKVIVYKLDRISRNVLDFYNLYDFMKKHNCTFSSVHDNLETDSPGGRLIMSILITFAEMERENIQLRVKTSYYERAETDGRFLGGRVPFAFNLGKTADGISTLIPNEKIDIVKILFQKYAYDTDCSLTKLVKYLKSEHNIIKSAAAINVILSNPLYVKADKKLYNYFKGLECNLLNDIEEWDGKKACFIINKTDQTGEKTKPNPPTEWTVYITNWNGHIDSRTYLLCQERLKQNTAFSTDNTTKGKFKELSGLVKCAKCGRAVKIKNNYGSMSCTGRSELQGACDVSFKGIKLEHLQQQTAEEMQKYLNNFSENQRKWKKKKDDLQNKINKVNMQIENIIDSIENEKNQEIRNALKKRLEKRTKEQAQLNLKMQLDISPSDKIEYRVLKILQQTDAKNINVYNVQYNNLSTEQKQALLKILINKIFLSEDGNIKIEWKE